MKEAIRLTNMQPKSTLREGDIFMAEPGKSETNLSIQDKTSVVSTGSRISPERVQKAEQLWREHYRIKGIEDISKLPFEEQRTVKLSTERGISPMIGGAPTISEHGIIERQLLSPIDLANRLLADIPDNQLEEQIDVLEKTLERIVSLSGVDLAQQEEVQRRLVDRLIPLRRQSRERLAQREVQHRRRELPEGAEGRFWRKLGIKDFEMLSDERQLVEWTNQQFDTLYEAARGKDPAQSPAYQGVNTAFEEAVTFLESTHPEWIGQLSELFETRIRLMNMNSAISTKDLESVGKAAFGLTAHGLLEGLRLDNGRVGSMFNRMSELLEDLRLQAPQGHVTPEMATKLQEHLIIEQVELARRGFGDFAHVNGEGEDTVARREILRAVRTAYDILVDSQRMAVIAARGQHLFGTDAFFSDAGAAFKVFNMDTFATAKWGLFNVEDEKFNRLVKNSLVDEWLEEKHEKYPKLVLSKEQNDELGDMLLKDMSVIPDFFSSGWRIKGVFDQMIDYFEHKIAFRDSVAVYGLSGGQKQEARNKATDFGLFMQLKAGADFSGRGRNENAVRTDVWNKVTDYRSEEIIRLMRERLSTDELKEVNERIFHPYGVTDYDEFKKRFGSAIRMFREQGFRADDHMQTNFASLTLEQKDSLNRATGNSANVIEQIYQSMQSYIREKGIISELFEKDYRFADLYSRTITPDDALLYKLEDIYLEDGYHDMIPLTKRWSNDLGGDALVRNIRDLIAGNAYVDEYMAFVRSKKTEDRLKHAEESAKQASNVNGREAEAKVLRHTIVTFLQASEIPILLDALGISKLPFRIPMSELEKIYGPDAKPLSQDERRRILDELRSTLFSSVKNRQDEIDKNPLLNPQQKEEKKLDVLKKAEKYYKSAERNLKVRGIDIAVQRGLRLIIYLLLAVLIEFAKLAESAIKEK